MSKYLHFWRPAMGWAYIIICLHDFVIGPTIYNILQFYNPGEEVTMWHPLTMENGGIFHLSSCAAIGVNSMGLSKETLADKLGQSSKDEK